jgi:hypothetical protein
MKAREGLKRELMPVRGLKRKLRKIASGILLVALPRLRRVFLPYAGAAVIADALRKDCSQTL